MQKVATDLFFDSTTEPVYSEVVSIGSHNAAMFEVWLKSATSVATFTATLQGSNDKLKWADARATNTATPSVTAPSYGSNTNTGVIPFEYLRLKFSMTGTSPTALVDASIRTFTTSA